MKNQSWQQLFEKSYPYLWAFIMAGMANHFGPLFELGVSEAQVSNTTTIASILMGFIGTSYGILLSATSKRIEWAKGQKRVWREILRFFNESFIANFALCLYSIALSAAAANQLPEWSKHPIFTLWVFLIILSIVSFFRAIRILLGLLKSDY